MRRAPEAILEIQRLAPAHAGALARLFERIAADSSSRRFHPHPFTAAEAERIARLRGKDLYFGLCGAERLLGYGMLRGWDDGYDLPRLGIYVLPEMRGTGAARLLMHHLHLAAGSKGARAVQLTVHPDNLPAVKLYRSMGYVFDATPLADGRIVGDLALDPGHLAEKGTIR